MRRGILTVTRAVRALLLLKCSQTTSSFDSSHVLLYLPQLCVESFPVL